MIRFGASCFDRGSIIVGYFVRLVRFALHSTVDWMLLRKVLFYAQSWFLICGIGSVICMSSNAAHTITGPKITNERRLEQIDEERLKAVDRVGKLRRKIDILSTTRVQLNRRLIETAQRIKNIEAQLSAAENRLSDLKERESALQISLATRYEDSGHLLGALQKIGRIPPPALIVRPEDALSAIRSSIVLENVLSHLRRDVLELMDDLSEMVNLRNSIEKEYQHLVLSQGELMKERIHLETLIETKRSTLVVTEAELLKTSNLMEVLARETNTLKELIDGIAGHVSFPKNRSTLTAQDAARTEYTSSKNFGRTEPALAFSTATGMLPWPVHGRVLFRFGETNALGYPAHGISTLTRSGAQVISPADGWVVYAGNFRSYGRLLILNVGEGYHIVLAGFKKFDVKVGQFVLVGEPVGTMGTGMAQSQSMLSSGPLNDPVLYIEFRKNGDAIDPNTWWLNEQS